MTSIWQEFLSNRDNARVWSDNTHPLYKMNSDTANANLSNSSTPCNTNADAGVRVETMLVS